MKKRYYQYFLSIFLAAVLMGCNKAEASKEIIVPADDTPITGITYNEAVQVDENTVDKIIAHAMGEIDGMCRTNSLEAFKSSYDKGIRYFEVDFYNTVDHKIVAIHDWLEWFEWQGLDANENPYHAMSHSDFMVEKIAGKYTPLDIEAVAQLMIEYPDIHLITDTKRKASKYFCDDISRLYMKLELAQKGLADRLIVQVYNEFNLEEARKMFPDKNIIFTAYMSGLDSKGIAEICKKYPDLYAVTVEKEKITTEIIDAATAAGLKIYVHTVNSDEDWQSLLAKGVYGLYSDNLAVELVKE